MDHLESLGQWKVYKDTKAEDHIRERAYFLWLEAGCPSVSGEQFWFAAEQEYLSSTFPASITFPGLDYDSSEEVTIELTQRYNPSGYFYHPDGITSEFKPPVVEDIIASRAGILTRFGKKLIALAQLAQRRQNSGTKS